MAVKKANKIWNGMNIVQEVDTETGVISIKSRPTKDNPDGSVLANSAADGSWSLKNETEFICLFDCHGESAMIYLSCSFDMVYS